MRSEGLISPSLLAVSPTFLRAPFSLPKEKGASAPKRKKDLMCVLFSFFGDETPFFLPKKERGSRGAVRSPPWVGFPRALRALCRVSILLCPGFTGCTPLAGRTVRFKQPVILPSATFIGRTNHRHLVSVTPPKAHAPKPQTTEWTELPPKPEGWESSLNRSPENNQGKLE